MYTYIDSTNFDKICRNILVILIFSLWTNLLFKLLNSVRTIDGILLTKFDTIDDKVGAALSMTYTSGAPILFVGSGQTYVDLRKLNVKSIVKSLLS